MAILAQSRESGGLTRHTLGNALVVYPKGHLTTQARRLALTVPADTENDLVVVDLPASPPIAMWESVARVLPKGRRGVRLVIGGRSRETGALAGHWLAERLRRPVLVPDGMVVQGAGGSLFVHSGQDSGWVRCMPGRAPAREAKRFPRPNWDEGLVADTFPTSARGLAEPLPSGVWIRPIEDDPPLRAHRMRLIEVVPCQPDYVTIVLGRPGGIPLGQDDIVLVWRNLPERVRECVRFIQYGPMSVPKDQTLGQLIADTLQREVVLYPGLPIGPAVAPEIFTVLGDGTFGWHCYAKEIAYRPRASQAAPAAVPSVVSHRAPIPGATEISPGVYKYSVDAVVEVVQSGLLLRPPAATGNLDAIRSIPVDPRTHHLMFDAATEADLRRVEHLASDLAQRLSESVRPMNRVVSAGDVLRMHAKQSSSHAASGIAETALSSVQLEGTAVAPAPPPADGAEITSVVRPIEMPTEQPIAPIPPVAGPARAMAAPSDAAQVGAHGTAEAAVTEDPVSAEVEPAPVPVPAPVPAVARLQVAPTAEAAALVPKRGIDDERAWLRRTLAAEYGTRSTAVARVLSEHPGLQGVLSRSSTEVLTDAVAVQLYLSARGQAVDEALRTGRVGAHVPLARCVVAGLSRLPSHRGPAVFSASPSPDQWQLYRDHRLLTEWGFLHALTEPADIDGTVDILVWSMTARRTRLLEPESDGVHERVLFVPGTNFKVLGLIEPQGDQTRGRLLLRELTALEVDNDGRVDPNRISLDELALRSLQRQFEKWAGQATAQVPPEMAARFGMLPGLSQE